jgi:hypothetical protein
MWQVQDVRLTMEIDLSSFRTPRPKGLGRIRRYRVVEWLSSLICQSVEPVAQPARYEHASACARSDRPPRAGSVARRLFVRAARAPHGPGATTRAGLRLPLA